MSAGGVVEQHESVGDVKPGPITDSILVLHIENSVGTALIGSVCERLKPEARLIAVVPSSDLETTLSVMQASQKVSAVLVAEGLTSTTVARAASKLLYGDIFGLEKIVPWGTRVYSTLVGSYNDKSVCIAEMSEFAKAMSVRRKYREAIEQCADEMLMNALYDAPVDSNGNSLFAEIPIKERIKIQVEEKPVVQYACSDQTFMFSVRDNYGTLARDTVLKYLDKCLHAEEQIDRKTGGAGLGLYLMASQTTQLIFNVLPGVATECICTFDLQAPKVQLTDLSMFFERIDARGRLDPGRPTILPGGVGFPVERRQRNDLGGNKAVLWGLSSAIALLVALIALVAYPRFTKSTGVVEVSTNPQGAQITLDGNPRGTTANGPLRLELKLGSSYQIGASKEGWSPAASFVRPTQGEVTEIVLNMQSSGSTVLASADPEGAEVFVDGQSVGISPITLSDLKPGSDVNIEFRKAGYTSRTRHMTVPAAGGNAEVSVALSLSPKFGALSITSDPPGASILQNGELLAGLLTPVSEHLVPAASKHIFTLRLDGYQPAHLPVRVARGQSDEVISAKLVPGGGVSVSSNIAGTVSVQGQKACKDMPLPMQDCPLANGKYSAQIESRELNIRHSFDFEVNNNLVDQMVSFAIVEASGQNRLVLSNGRKVKRIALEPGSHTLALYRSETDTVEEVRVQLEAEQELKLP